MKKFLQKYLTTEQIAELEKKYLEEHADAKELPVYISKSRLDEVLAQKKDFEARYNEANAAYTKLQEDQKSAIEKAVKEAEISWKKTSQEEIESLKKDFEITEAIYGAKGRNVKALKALINPDKDYKDEIARLQKETPYLFQGELDDVPSGTGKKGSDGGNSEEKEINQMRAAVGLIL